MSGSSLSYCSVALIEVTLSTDAAEANFILESWAMEDWAKLDGTDESEAIRSVSIDAGVRLTDRGLPMEVRDFSKVGSTYGTSEIGSMGLEVVGLVSLGSSPSEASTRMWGKVLSGRSPVLQFDRLRDDLEVLQSRIIELGDLALVPTATSTICGRSVCVSFS